MCEDQGMEVSVPLKKVSPNKASGNRYVKDDFIYDREEDHYMCPAGQKLVRRGARVKRGGSWYLDYSARVQICRACPLATRCLPPLGSRRCLGRWEHEDVMRKRGALVDHPFGTLKRRADLDHFRMRGLVTCQGEFNLMILCSNLKRVLNEIKMDAFRAYCRVRQEAQGSRV